MKSKKTSNYMLDVTAKIHVDSMSADRKHMRRITGLRDFEVRQDLLMTRQPFAIKIPPDIFPPWMNKLLDKSANRLIGEEFILDMEQYRLEIIGGAWENVSYDEKRFISHVLKIEDVREICLVREMGFADVWIVFSELSCERELEIIAYCNEFLDGRAENDPQAPKIDFLVLTPENFTGDVPFPSIHIRRGGAGDAD